LETARLNPPFDAREAESSNTLGLPFDYGARIWAGFGVAHALPFLVGAVAIYSTHPLINRDGRFPHTRIVHTRIVINWLAAIDSPRQRGRHADAVGPDLALLDLNLPRRTGGEALAEVKVDPNLQSTPIVVLTTSVAERDVVQSYSLHANCYITKSIDFSHFIEVYPDRTRDFRFLLSIRQFAASAIAIQ
jgi:CheY-like chemotaxis protein